MRRVLVVDDEASIRKLLQFNLEKENYDVTTAKDGQEALDLALEDRFDFILLDLMLPKINGIDVCRQIRQSGSDVPIMILTAKEDETEKIIGLEIGADDYLTKPFSPREVLARMRAIFRRTDKRNHLEQEEKKGILKRGDISIDLDDYVVSVRGKVVEMTRKEFELLAYMARHEHRLLSRERLLERIWNFDYSGETRIVDVHVSHLREKIEKDTKRPEYILTVRGFGYKFEVPES